MGAIAFLLTLAALLWLANRFRQHREQVYKPYLRRIVDDLARQLQKDTVWRELSGDHAGFSAYYDGTHWQVTVLPVMTPDDRHSDWPSFLRSMDSQLTIAMRHFQRASTIPQTSNTTYNQYRLNSLAAAAAELLDRLEIPDEPYTWWRR